MKEKSKEEIERETKKLLSKIATFEKDAQEQGFEFNSLSRKEVIDKLLGKTSKSPFIPWQSYQHTGGIGDTLSYTVGIYNPDSISYSLMRVSVFFGVANFLPDIAFGLCGRYREWPVLSSEDFVLGSKKDEQIHFNYTVPTGIPYTTYLGNSVLWSQEWHDVGKYFDRACFSTRVLP